MGRISVTALVVVVVFTGVPGNIPPPRTPSDGHHHLAEPHSRHRVAATQAVEALAEGSSAGRWSALIDFPLVPAAAALLPNDKVLTWSAYLPDAFACGTGRTVTAIFDPATGTVTPRTVSDTGHDMFCPGISAPRLSQRHLVRLEQVLDSGPAAAGYADQRRTLARVATGSGGVSICVTGSADTFRSRAARRPYGGVRCLGERGTRA